MTDLDLLAACILSDQVEARDVVRLCRENPALEAALRESERV